MIRTVRRRVARRQIGWWLIALCVLIFAMVLLGGYTRLTESGLSMTEWRPITGLLPPLSDQAWQAEFARYQHYPEFQKLNSWMDLGAFKGIYYVEYAHRMLGRLIGVVFVVPFVYFVGRRRIPRGLTPKLTIMFLLGALQGLMGWYMVKSGLVERPDVSQYRLTAHLAFAVVIYAYILWTALGLLVEHGRSEPHVRKWAGMIGGLVFVQIMLGGLVAGLDAGHAYNTWPLMDGSLLPSGLMAMRPWYVNLTENLLTVQFDHRLLAYAIVVVTGVFWWRLHRAAPPGLRGAVHLVALAVLAQVTLGIVTLVHNVPITLGIAHQGGALLLLSAVIYCAYVSRHRPSLMA